MTHLILDIGNTRAKMAVVTDGIICERFVADSVEDLDIDTICNKYSVTAALASVVGRQPDFASLLPHDVSGRFHQLSYKSRLPITIDYDTPQTLGMDRVAAVVGARQLCHEGSLVVVDAGSCITVDLLDDSNCYRGGAIMPGLAMRFKAMHTFTDALPMVTLSPEEQDGTSRIPLTGKSTRGSLMSGVCRSVLFEIEGFVNDYKKEYGDVKLFLTGGDAVFFANQLNFPNFASSDLVFIGLDKILEINI